MTVTAASAMIPPTAQERELLRQLPSILLREGYTDSYYVFGTLHLRCHRMREQLGALPPSVRALLRLFLLAEEVLAEELTGVFSDGDLAALQRTGLLCRGPAGLHTSGLILLPAFGLLAALPARLVHGAPAALADALVLGAGTGLLGARCADLGPGPALPALHTAAAGGQAVVVAEDDEALGCVLWSAALSGLEPRLDIRRGPIEAALRDGERFDRIAATFWPGAAAMPGPLDRLLTRLPKLLAAGGTARIVVSCSGAGEVEGLARLLQARTQAHGERAVLTLASRRSSQGLILTVTPLAARPGLLRSSLHPDGFYALATRTLRELPAIAAVCARHQIARPRPEDFLKAGEAVIFSCGEHLVKLMAPHLRSHLRAEEAVLRRVHGRLGTATPDVLAAGEAAGWPYLLLRRLPGRPLRAVYDALTEEERQRLATELGQALRRLHELPIEPPDDIPELQRRWPEFLAERLAACAAHHRALGAWPQWLDEQLADVRAAAALLSAGPHPVLLHADLSDENVLVERRGGRWGLAGLVDFGDARLGDWDYDLVAPGLHIARGSADVLAALLRGYGAPPPMRQRLVALTWLHHCVDLPAVVANIPGASRGGQLLAELLWPAGPWR